MSVCFSDEETEPFCTTISMVKMNRSIFFCS